jgi:Tol biopolymer transport system component/DNA-binding CsgD family transcriptional regulator
MARRGRPPYPDILTPREWDVLRLLDEGLTNDQIAERLGISRDGAKYHVAQILAKLGVSSRHEAAAAARDKKPSRLKRLAFAPIGLSLTKGAKLAVGAGLAGVAGAVVVLAVLLLLADEPLQPAQFYPGIYTLDVEGGRIERKADLRGSRVMSFDWSDDGRQLLVRRPHENDKQQTDFIDATTGAVTSTTEDFSESDFESGPGAVWNSPDGSLTASFGASGLEVRDQGGNLRALIPGDRGFSVVVQWSPDSRWLAVIHGPHGEPHSSRLYVVAADGSDARELSPAATPADYWNAPGLWLDWSPDSRFLAFVRDGELWTADVLSGRLKQQVVVGIPLVTEPRWSPDGRQIAFRTSAIGGVYVAKADGSEKTFLGPGETARLSPDGRRAVLGFGGIFTVRVDGTGAAIVSHDDPSEVVIMTDFFPRRFCGIQFPPALHPPTWSPDGRFIAATRGLDPPSIIIWRSDGKSEPVAAGEGWAQSWSPDGTRFAYVRDCLVHVAAVNGGVPGRVLFSAPGLSYKWRADGGLEVTPLDSGTRVLDRDGNALNVAPEGRSGRLIAEYESVSTSQGFLRTVYLRDSATGQLLHTLAGASTTAFSPDGRSLAFVRHLDVGLLETNRLALVLLDLETLQEQVVQTGWEFRDLLWAPDSSRLAFRHYLEEGEVRVASRGAAQVVSLGPGRVLEWLPNAQGLLLVSP